MLGLGYPRKNLFTKPLAGTKFNKNWPLFKGLQAFYGFLDGCTYQTREDTEQHPKAIINGTPSISIPYGIWPQTPRSPFGQALEANPSGGGWVDCGNICDNMSSFTVAFWGRFNNAANQGLIIGKIGSGSIASGQGWYVTGFNQTGGGITHGVQLSGGIIYNQIASTTANPIADNKWHHLAVTVSNYVATSIYIDGKAVATQNESAGGGVVATTTNTNDMSMLADTADGNTWSGFIDLMGVWNRVLSANEVQELYVRPLGMYKIQKLPNSPLKISATPTLRGGLVEQATDTIGSNIQSLLAVSASGNLVESIETIGSNIAETEIISGGLVEPSDTIGGSIFTGTAGVGIAGNLIEPATDVIGAGVALPQTTSANLAERGDTIGSNVSVPLPNSLIILRRKNARTKPPLGSLLDSSRSLINGLVMAVLMNEGGGTKALDLVTGQKGFVGGTSGPTWQSGPFGSALNFLGPGAAGRITFVDNPLYQDLWTKGEGMSVSLWFKTSNYAQIVADGGVMVFGKSDSTDGGNATGSNYGWNLILDNWHDVNNPTYNNVTFPPSGSNLNLQNSGNVVMKLEFENASFNKAGGVYIPNDNQLHHLVITTDKAGLAPTINDYRIYLDGNQIISFGTPGAIGSRWFITGCDISGINGGTGANGGAGSTQSDVGYNLAIGTHPNGATGFLGILDNVMIWNRAITPAEALQVFVEPFCHIRPQVKKIVTPALPKLISRRFPFPYMKVI